MAIFQDLMCAVDGFRVEAEKTRKLIAELGGILASVPLLLPGRIGRGAKALRKENVRSTCLHPGRSQLSNGKSSS